jgi:LPS sulfotransferase NodH
MVLSDLEIAWAVRRLVDDMRSCHLGSPFTSDTDFDARIGALRQVFPDHERQARAILDQFTRQHAITRRPTSGRGYLLCITPRSGSSLLADVLGRTGSIGSAHEHFRAGEPLSEWMTRCADLTDCLAALERNAPAGYFGIKGDLFQMFPLISDGFFAGPGCIFKHVYLTRRDTLGQAISLARAVKTNEWHSHDQPVPDPELRLEEIVSNLRYIREMEADWETVFSALRVAPLRLYYEDLIAGPALVFEQVRQYLDLRWKIDPGGIVSEYQSVSGRHDPEWLRKQRSRF